ncbi:hypothetical protein DRO61_09700 [Candidatus Bathyarchaeota archaeon]|nr:MAG: hypothetical protein DRO61_09700 [Candidatus Bathyarchaeota archaeon]RXG62899.1 MAG: DUF3830 family protein [Candidatus Atribacteria bacterium 1244-E10-H5-B2]
MFYGRDIRIFLTMGWRLSNYFGSIVENFQEFAEICDNCQSEGKKLMKIERVE